MSVAATGKKFSDEHRAAISVSKLGALKGPRNGNWKGDQAGYKALHEWVKRWKTKTGKCSVCPFVGYTEWANISGVYFRDLDDYAEMCVGCHEEFDHELY